MMYPRLRVARSLLRSDGVIFISIDDGEVGHLRALCDDVFGQENFFAQIPWQSRTSVQNDTDLSVQHEYLVGYAVNRRREHRRLKESNVATWFSLPSFAAYPLPVNDERYHNPDDDPRGAWKADPFDAPNVRDNLTYAITNPQTGEEYWPPAGRCWRTEEPKFESLLADGRIVFGRTGKSRPQLKVFYEEKKLFGEVPVSWFSGTEYGTSTAGTKELQDLFDGVSPFPFPKPTSLLQALLRLTTHDDDLVMDFFAGSGTTAHAVWKQNAEDQGDRRWIQVQLPEPLDPDKPAERAAVQLCDDLGAPRLISTLTKERIRRAASAFGEQAGDLADVATTDRGFRVLKLDSSNIEAWEPNRDDLGGSLTDTIEHLKDDRTEHDILFELLLKLGLELTVLVETREVAGKTVYSVGAGTLLVCLADSLDQGDVEAIGLGIVEWHEELDPAGDSTVVFRDNAFADDVAKTNLTAILEQHGLSTVRSL